MQDEGRKTLVLHFLIGKQSIAKKTVFFGKNKRNLFIMHKSTQQKMLISTRKPDLKIHQAYDKIKISKNNRLQ